METKMEPLDFGQTEDTSKNIIKVIGVGGGGCNAVKNMYNEGIVNVTFAICNTDSQSLSTSNVPVKIMLGDKGLGVGGVPEEGRKEAQSSIDKIKQFLVMAPRWHSSLREWVAEQVLELVLSSQE